METLVVIEFLIICGLIYVWTKWMEAECRIDQISAKLPKRDSNGRFAKRNK